MIRYVSAALVAALVLGEVRHFMHHDDHDPHRHPKGVLPDNTRGSAARVL